MVVGAAFSRSFHTAPQSLYQLTSCHPMPKDLPFSTFSPKLIIWFLFLKKKRICILIAVRYYFRAALL